MKRTATVLRHYSEADAVMRQHMRTMYGHFLAHQAAFETFNPEFAAPFGANWLGSLNLADTTPVGALRVGELKEDTAEMLDGMEGARQGIQTLFYFVGRAYPHNAGRLDTYGRALYEGARKQRDKLRAVVQQAFDSATRDHAALATKGYTPAMLTAFGELLAQLTEVNSTQAGKKGTNTEDSDHYLTVQNLAYGYGQEVSAAAKIFLADAPATLALFRLSGAAPSGLEHHELTAPANASASVAFATVLLPTTRLHLRLAVPTTGQKALVGRVLSAGAPLTVYATLNDENSELDVLASDLGPAGQVLVVRSEGDAPVRVEMTVLA